MVVRVLFAASSLAYIVPGLCAQPRYAADGTLALPGDYREWVFLSSGLGMTYQEPGAHGMQMAPAFTNVFVNPAAYRSFIASGKWPDKTMLILEERSSESKGSINKGGSYQTDLLGIEAEVKDLAKVPGNGWAFFGFGKSSTGTKLPRTAECYSCHAEHAAVDNTFVQFYPALLPIAKQKGTLAAGR